MTTCRLRKPDWRLHMDGLVILSQTAEMTKTFPSWALPVALIGSMVIATIFFVMYIKAKSEILQGIFVLLAILLGCAFALVVMVRSTYEVPSGKTIYTATAGEVNLDKFYSTYEVLSYKDGVFTLKDK
jgi:hypothetical protein